MHLAILTILILSNNALLTLRASPVKPTESANSSQNGMPTAPPAEEGILLGTDEPAQIEQIQPASPKTFAELVDTDPIYQDFRSTLRYKKQLSGIKKFAATETEMYLREYQSLCDQHRRILSERWPSVWGQRLACAEIIQKAQRLTEDHGFRQLMYKMDERSLKSALSKERQATRSVKARILDAMPPRAPKVSFSNIKNVQRIFPVELEISNDNVNTQQNEQEVETAERLALMDETARNTMLNRRL